MNRWYFGHNPGTPDCLDEKERCDCGAYLYGERARKRGTCDECHRAEDESERWAEKRTGTED